MMQFLGIIGGMITALAIYDLLKYSVLKALRVDKKSEQIVIDIKVNSDEALKKLEAIEKKVGPLTVSLRELGKHR